MGERLVWRKHVETVPTKPGVQPTPSYQVVHVQRFTWIFSNAIPSVHHSTRVVIKNAEKRM